MKFGAWSDLDQTIRRPTVCRSLLLALAAIEPMINHALGLRWVVGYSPD
jgi:hypothetical protein